VKSAASRKLVVFIISFKSRFRHVSSVFQAFSHVDEGQDKGPKKKNPSGGDAKAKGLIL
jgi:hypothetical protein